MDRSQKFFERRLAAGNAEELKEFKFWLEAECLDAEWRLRALSRTLDVTKSRGRSASILVERLHSLQDTNLDLVVECFAKLTEGALTHQHFYLLPEQAKAILRAGFASKNQKTVANAKKAQEILLSVGHSEYLHLDDVK